jgi:peptidoglycan/xylan/chitin deacetylase (PgdA/CDA1 family)
MTGLAKELAIICSAGVIHFSGLAVLTRHLTRGRIPILTYHSVSESDECSPSCLDLTRMRVAPGEFRKQMQYVARHYNTVRLADVVRARQGDTALPENPCVITFDDGYADVYENVAPVLEELGLTATFFVIGRTTATGEMPWLHAVHEMVDTVPIPECAAAFHKAAADSFSAETVTKDELCRQVLQFFDTHDRSTRARFLDVVRAELSGRVPQRRRFLDAAQVRELHERGFEIGGHSMDHDCLARLTTDELRADIRQCREVLADTLSHSPQTFCYPFGWQHSFDSRVIDILKREDFRCATTTIPGLNDASTDPFMLHRIMVYTDTSLPLFVFRLLGLEAKSRSLYGSVRSALRAGDASIGDPARPGAEHAESAQVSRSPWS